MTLRKWRSNSASFLQTIPSDLHAEDDSTLAIAPAHCAKTLGLHWNTATDTLHISTPVLEDVERPTKWQVASAVAHTFDVQGWFSPVTVSLKILLQKVWQARISWDDIIPDELLPAWSIWKDQLPDLTVHPIHRYVANSSVEVIDRQLHGFTDASMVAYGGVVYLRLLHADTTVSISLITSRTRVAPLSGLTIPRLELCGAQLLARLLESIAVDMVIALDHVYAWCDSSVVLGWLNQSPAKLEVFVANRVGDVCSRDPADQWRYVATDCNPADYASRGLSPHELLQAEMWWSGPPWLSLSPDTWPRRPDINLGRELPELKATVLMIRTEGFPLWTKYSTHDRLLRVVAWCKRFAHNCRRKSRDLQPQQTADKLQAARITLLKCSQHESYSDVINLLKAGKELPVNHPLLSVRPLLGNNGLLRVGGRLQHSDLAYHSTHPIILDRRSWFARLLVDQIHVLTKHAGPSTMLSTLAENYFIKGVKKLTKSVSNSCVSCKRAYAKTAHQLMGQLPADHVRPSPPFAVVGLDFAGPFLCKQGNPRKPTLVKAYARLYICFMTKAIHI